MKIARMGCLLAFAATLEYNSILVRNTASGAYFMTTQVQNILSNFDALPVDDQRELAAEILKRSILMDSPILTDDQLTAMADELFLRLDGEETENG
jgi:hypothetical protein